MTVYESIFPKCSHLWHGAVLRTIAHAIFIAADSSLSYEVSWDGKNYTRQDSMGSRGTITFAEDYVLGAFFDEKSSRNPFRIKSAIYDLDKFLVGIPTEQLSYLREETLRYLFEEYQGELRPIITSAFWSAGEYLTASESWNVVFTHGAHLIWTEIMDEDDAVAALQGEYEFSASQTALLRSVFTQRTTTPFDDYLILGGAEYGVLVSGGIAGLEESKQLLEAIHIKVP